MEPVGVQFQILQEVRQVQVGNGSQVNFACRKRSQQILTIAEPAELKSAGMRQVLIAHVAAHDSNLVVLQILPGPHTGQIVTVTIKRHDIRNDRPDPLEQALALWGSPNGKEQHVFPSLGLAKGSRP